MSQWVQVTRLTGYTELPDLGGREITSGYVLAVIFLYLSPAGGIDSDQTEVTHVQYTLRYNWPFQKLNEVFIIMKHEWIVWLNETNWVLRLDETWMYFIVERNMTVK